MRNYFLLPLLLVLALAAANSAAAASKTSSASLVAPEASCPNASRADLTPEAAKRAMTCLVDYARARKGLSPLKLQTQLARAASYKLTDQVRCDVFSHTACGRPLLSVFKRSGYVSPSYSYVVGENLAWGAGEKAAPRQILVAWLDSPSHRKNLLSRDWREMGFGFARVEGFAGLGAVTLWSHSFGKRW